MIHSAIAEHIFSLTSSTVTMSRLIVKNLPPYITPTQLQEHFQQKGNPGGTITDVKVSQKSDGTSRRFGFVGYKSEQEALAAQKWFHHTFIGSTRISVNFSEVSQNFSVTESSFISLSVGDEGRTCTTPE